MINLSVDEAFAFDYLSILHLKVLNDLGNQDKFNTYVNCAENLVNELGHEPFQQIIQSNEYKSLHKANEDTFQAVDKARYGSITAKEVDECNMLRFKAKQALQKRFFIVGLAESKT